MDIFTPISNFLHFISQRITPLPILNTPVYKGHEPESKMMQDIKWIYRDQNEEDDNLGEDELNHGLPHASRIFQS